MDAKKRQHQLIVNQVNAQGKLPDWVAEREQRSRLALGTGQSFKLAHIADLNLRGRYDDVVGNQVIEAFIEENK